MVSTPTTDPDRTDQVPEDLEGTEQQTLAPASGIDNLRTMVSELVVQTGDDSSKLPGLDSLASTIAEQLTPRQLVNFLRLAIKQGKADQFRGVLDVLEIYLTETAFDDAEKIGILERAASQYGLSYWLGQQGKVSTEIGRGDITDWWDFFTTMATQEGFSAGTIDNVTQDNNLWKATGELARKMAEQPNRYRFLPAMLINNPQEVDRALEIIKDPIAFLEVLTGERWEDLCKSPEFLEAFVALSERPEGQSVEAAVVATTMLALQRS